MKAFCGLLLDLMVEGGPKIRDAEEGRLPEASLAVCACLPTAVISGAQPNEATVRRRVRSRWQLLYTLVNNPSLLGSRKHFRALQTSGSILNGTPKHGSKRGGEKDAAKASAEAVGPAETPATQEKSEGDP